MDERSAGFISQNEFIQRFWAAYTYDDVFSDESAKRDEDDKKKKKQIESFEV